ncbi:hypothetical protein [Pseudomonas aeruginosa]|uniref:Uncharacterized protein n=1 Tax=Pseudomonas phage EL TaxID=273133 RepID=Q2Z0P2_9CAUD|nr:hypothetical protein [Pseudomonas aeruginosa]YP_418222.1 hypothetical protein PPEV_gp189 [Pseudomonas phage EL]MBS9731062.1 hypothetical protein [Pseudomonas aeruginosa]MDH1421364.1 hypothetical protein [Pseudomonas aeruginosa]CAG27283.1 hypothetical protein [Pseudomonas phage EL]CRQ10879.1 hypothetical protein PAERUG_E6_London_17_VIM_2_12_12_03526 [Pseudomonas aeruginosa]HDU8983290.1 hypothetical protein [Pseudomonas aeruginosa]
MKAELINNVIALANTAEFVKQTIRKVGLEYIAPLDPSIQAEKISKALTKRVVKQGANQ